MSEEVARWWDEATLDRSRWGGLVEPTLARLIRARDRNRLPHALLLVGPAGLGRELAAMEAAVLLVCEGAEAPWSEGGDARRVRRGLHPDVQAVLPTGAAEIIKISQIREIVEGVASRPFEGRSRVWILDGVEAGHLGAEAANAFLKTLEEPPLHAHFFLLAANPEAVLPTIRSRCQRMILPGPVAVAERLVEASVPPELAAFALVDEGLEGTLREVRTALTRGFEGETRNLLRLPYVLPAKLSSFCAVAAVAVEMAGENQDGDVGEELMRLASELLAVERRSRSLNLNVRGQMVSCLMRWHRGL